MNQPDDTPPSGVLVIDGNRIALARAPGETRPVAGKRVLAGEIVPEALLVASMAEPRRQRTGPQSIVGQALRDVPFYAFADACAPKAREAIEAHRTPVDRMLSTTPAEAGAYTLPVANGEQATLLAAVFADLAARSDSARERQAQKWAFGDVKRALAPRLSQFARESARANRPLRLVHTRCGDRDWSVAVDPYIDYLGVDDRAQMRAAASRASARPVRAPEDLSRDTDGEAGLFLLTDLAGEADLKAALAPLGAMAARASVVVAVLPHGRSGNADHAIIGEPRINRLANALQVAFGGTCEMRRLETIAHKPSDALPGTTLVEFEVTR